MLSSNHPLGFPTPQRTQHIECRFSRSRPRLLVVILGRGPGICLSRPGAASRRTRSISKNPSLLSQPPSPFGCHPWPQAEDLPFSFCRISKDPQHLEEPTPALAAAFAFWSSSLAAGRGSAFLDLPQHLPGSFIHHRIRSTKGTRPWTREERPSLENGFFRSLFPARTTLALPLMAAGN